MRVAVAGKGGSGKSMLAGTLARVLARSGRRVLALDADTMPGLALSIGVRTPPVPALAAAAERGQDGRWRFAPGVGPVRAVQRFAYRGPDGVRLLELGKRGADNEAQIAPAIQAFWRAIHGIACAPALRDWDFVGDLSAGPRQVGYGWIPYADSLLLIADASTQSLLTARRIVRVVTAGQRPVPIALVASQVTGAADLRRIEAWLDRRAAAVLPLDSAVAEAERLGVAPIDHAPGCPAVRAVEGLVG